MPKASECITCSENNIYSMDMQSIINRNARPFLGIKSQQNGNGTIQYITHVSITLGDLWFRSKPEDDSCNKSVDETKIPDKIKFFFDEELTKIFEELQIINSGNLFQITDTVSIHNKIINKEIKSLSSIISEIDLDVDNFNKDVINTRLSEQISAKEFTCNILTLKPEVWNQPSERSDLIKPLYVHADNRKKRTCIRDKNGNSRIATPFTRDGKRQVEVPYSQGDFGVWPGEVTRIYRRNLIAKDADTRPEPPISIYDIDIIPNIKNIENSKIPWTLALVPGNLRFTADQHKFRTIESITGCGEKITNKERTDILDSIIQFVDRFKKTFNPNIRFLCRLLKYAESLDPDDPKIDCEIQFYKNNKLLKPTNNGSNIRASLYVGFFQKEEDIIDFTQPLSIEIVINDENLDFPNDEKLNFIRLKCPASKNLNDLSKIEDYISAEVIEKDQLEHTETYIDNNTIYSKDYPFCSEETKDIPKGDKLLALDRTDNKVDNIWKNFLQEVEIGIMCRKASPSDDFDDTLTNNIKLSNYRSSLGEAGNGMTFYSHKVYKIEERAPNNEIVIRNKNLEPNQDGAYVDCIEGLFVDDELEITESNSLQNTFFEEFKVNKEQFTAPINCGDKKNVTARSDLFREAIYEIPIFILKKDKNGITKFIRHNIRQSFTLPFKCFFVGGNDTIFIPPDIENCSIKSIPITITVEDEPETKPFEEHFKDYKIKDIKDFFVIDSGQVLNTIRIDVYNAILPSVIAYHKKELESIGGPNFEYLPVPEGTKAAFYLKKGEPYDIEKDKTLPCKDKLNKAINNLKNKRIRSIQRYHQPLFTFLDDIAKINDTTIVSNFLNEAVSSSISLSNQNYYKKVLNSDRVAIYSSLQGITRLEIRPALTIITGDEDSLIERIYTTSNSDVYNKLIEKYNEGAPAFAKRISAPKAPNINPTLENLLGPEFKNPSQETPDTDLLLPWVYEKEISILDDIIRRGKFRQNTCGRGLLGEGE